MNDYFDTRRVDDSRGDDPPPVEPVRRNPRLSLRPGPLGGGVHEDGRPRRSPRADRAYKIGVAIGFVLAVATATVLAGALAHAVWLTIRFGLWL